MIEIGGLSACYLQSKKIIISKKHDLETKATALSELTNKFLQNNTFQAHINDVKNDKFSVKSLAECYFKWLGNLLKNAKTSFNEP